MNAQDKNLLATQLGAIASRAGKFIMSIYENAPQISSKPDGSPVSDADIGAERLIHAQLSQLLPGMPVVAEESFDPKKYPRLPPQFVLVDPLDGTREFIDRNGEFTVNIALIDTGLPAVGCVYAPARNLMYLAGTAAFRIDLVPGSALPPLEALRPIATRPYPDAGLRALASRSHLDSATQAVLAQLPVCSRVQAGSSLKFCVIAQGDADVYPRLAPTMEWDTAAGHAVLAAAGGAVIGQNGATLQYGKLEAGFRNSGFIAWGREPLLQCAP